MTPGMNRPSRKPTQARDLADNWARGADRSDLVKTVTKTRSVWRVMSYERGKISFAYVWIDDTPVPLPTLIEAAKAEIGNRSW